MQENQDKNFGTGDFGNLAQAYSSGRKGIPSDVLDCLWAAFGKKANIEILDIACGTGIPTRQLAERGARVTAVDIDSKMLEEARKEHTDNISYQIAAASALPFADRTFDAITIFSAFHWFADQESLQEMRRVLTPGGAIFVVNKNDVGDLWRCHRSILQPHVKSEIPRVKDKYNPAQVLADASFQNITKRCFQISEQYDLHQALFWMQSMSSWNLVPKEVRPKVLAELEAFCKTTMVNGVLERKIEIVTQLGFMPSAIDDIPGYK